MQAPLGEGGGTQDISIVITVGAVLVASELNWRASGGGGVQHDMTLVLSSMRSTQE